MNKTKKPRNKRHNPRRVTGDSYELAARRLLRLDTRRLTDIEQIEVLLKTEAAWREAREEYSPGAFNQLGHVYRLCHGIADLMGMENFEAICLKAREALQRYYDEDTHDPVPDDVAAIIQPMIDGLRLVLPEVPKAVYDEAYKASRTILINKALEQFDSLPPSYSDVALAVMSGEKVPSIAERTELPEEEVSIQARVVAAIVYTVKGDQTKEFPTTIAMIRKQGEELSRALRALLEAKRVVREHLEAEQARKAAA